MFITISKNFQKGEKRKKKRRAWLYFFKEVKDKPSIDLRGNRMRPYENYCWVSPAQEPALFSFLPSALREETDAEYTRTSSPTRCGSGSARSRRPLPGEGLWSRGGGSAGRDPPPKAPRHLAPPASPPCAAVGRERGHAWQLPAVGGSPLRFAGSRSRTCGRRDRLTAETSRGLCKCSFRGGVEGA